MSPRSPDHDTTGSEATPPVAGQRVGAFVVFADDEGVRYEVRLGSIMSLSDADSCQDATVMQLPGGRALLIRATLEQVLAWFT